MKKDLRWPVGIVMLLTVFVTANLLVMRLAGADPSFAVEPDYYRKAVGFDSTMAAERRSVALGWKASTVIAADDLGSVVTVTITDAHGAVVSGAAVSVSARFIGRANAVSDARLNEISGGRYQARIAGTHAGLWEVRVAATRGTDRFIAITRAEAVEAR